jgi:Xaa-Pro dipeptidase
MNNFMNNNTPTTELNRRMHAFRQIMDEQQPEWKMAMIFSKINVFYFTGTMTEGMLVIQRDKDAVFWARRTYERAVLDSNFEDIRPMSSYRNAVQAYTTLPSEVYLEADFVPLSMFQLLQKYFPFQSFRALDYQLAMTKAVKSDWELHYIKQAGKIHQRVFEDMVPTILRDGMSEADLGAELFAMMVKEGHQGTARFEMLDTEIPVAQLGFGENSMYPTNFNGPGGSKGLCPAVPSVGSRERKLRCGDLIFIDAGLGVNGYYSDKTMTYMFGKPLEKTVQQQHQKCVDIQYQIAEMLKPGNTPENIYMTIMDSLTEDFKENFMGFGNRQVKFLGHGVGLTIGELPVIAKGFKMPIQENMVFAIEPKKAIPGVGTVGIENTFVVTPRGGENISGDSRGLIFVE